jgi:hypothetical protein
MMKEELGLIKHVRRPLYTTATTFASFNLLRSYHNPVHSNVRRRFSSDVFHEAITYSVFSTAAAFFLIIDA